MSEAGYHQRDEISRSDLALFAKSRRLYEAIKVLGTVEADETSEAMAIGTATHGIALSDVLALENIVLIPAEVLSASGSKAGGKWKEFEAAHDGRTLLKEPQWEMAQRCAESIHKEIGPLLIHGKAHKEMEVYWQDILPCRCKLDYAIESATEVLVIDLKTAADISERGFWSAVKYQRYWLQDAHYSKGAEKRFDKPVRFMFAAVEKTGVFECRVYEMSAMDRQEADVQRFSLLCDLKACRESGDFSTKYEGVVTTLFPLGELV